MKVLVTGSTGFIGRYTIPMLLDQGLEVVATSRDEKKAKQFDWYNRVDYKPCDYQNENIDFFNFFGEPGIIIHLAWEGLPDYKNPVHVEKNLPASCRFLKNFLEGGVKKMVVTGTCYEYGMQYGCLSEDIITSPVTQYGLAKDALRKYLEFLMPEYNTSFNWIRLFYMYGEGQNEKSLIPQLKKAISNREKIFNMSGGEQLRDYLDVNTMVDYICKIALQEKYTGTINCCSGKPISIRRLVEMVVSEMGSEIRLNTDYYPYPDYEPMAFWGDNTKLNKVLGIDNK
ncbi:MAG: NAD(P)-dependent oxidoreductase [Methanogenium sp.]|nr:NAD(P)-dependent oxidoreductase [Methanogenium sp.]